jgi:hypothetical protein
MTARRAAEPRYGNATTLFHHAVRRRGGRVGTGGTGAAGSEDASGSLSVTWTLRASRPNFQHAHRLPAKTARPWLHGGTEPRYRATICRWEVDRLPGLAAELVMRKPDIIVAFSTTAALPAKQATGTTPIVAVGMADPVADGLIASLARPGGNVTGTTFLGPEVSANFLLPIDLCSNPSAEFDIHQARESSPHDGVSWRRIMATGEIAAHAGDLG